MLGVRVVRGPDWTWGNQDDGEGHVGTVVEVGKPGSKTTPDKTVFVQWDSGARTNYRVGLQDAYDLRVFDNAQTGVKHPNIICDSCKRHGISGIRWKCSKCFDFDLCTTCFMADKHDITHPFIRYESTQGMELPKRQGATKVQTKGIFVGAKVTRGPDWDWGNQDGGEGKVGKVTEIRGWVNESERSVANVMWASGFTNVYRCGHKGRVDLKYIQEAPGGYYYRDLLPVLGKVIELPIASSDGVRLPTFNIGDYVKVLQDVESLQQMQEGHGGWNPRMAEYIGKVGKVHRVTDKGDIRVQYEGCKNRWTFHPGALTKVTMFSIGDLVKVITDRNMVKELQEGHGEWIEIMADTIGKVGTVLKIYSDGDLRVNIDNQTWTFNPLCLVAMPNSTTELNNSMRSHVREDHSSPLSAVIGQLMEQKLDTTSVDQLVREAAQGHRDNVRDLLQKFPELLDQKSSGKTALQVACHQGHKDIVKLLLTANSNPEIKDDDGDTALHYSAFGDQPEIMEILLQKGVCKDVMNNGRCSALHVSVNKQHVACARVLLNHGSDVNIQDSYGDTALHDAIGKDNSEIVDLLINRPNVDLMLKNKRGFNVLHHAALKGNKFATEKIISRSRQIVDIKKDDGFAALHLAALNGHYDVTNILVEKGQCDINIHNNRQQTPLLLAVSQGHCNLVEYLVVQGADINAKDEDGDNVLHLSLMRLSSSNDSLSRNRSVEYELVVGETIGCEIKMILDHLQSDGIEHYVKLGLACFLAQEDCDINCANNKGKKPTDLIAGDNDVITLLQQYSSRPSCRQKHLEENESLKDGMVNKVGHTEPNTSTYNQSVTDDLPNECYICADDAPNVVFEPCGHRITCQVCSLRMKKCALCQSTIMKKIGPGGRLISTKGRDPSAERVTYLENKIQEIQEAHTCSICMERIRNVAFLCGHGACVQCAQTLKTCHMCRKNITKKINLYV